MTSTEASVPESLTAAALTAILRGEGHDVEVTAVEVAPVGTGQMASSLRVRPTYAETPTDLPATFVAKLPGSEATRGTAGGAYRTEVRFYRELAPTLAIRVPRCWHAWDDEDGDFLLLLDDLAPAVQGDQLAGCTPAQAEAAVVNLAGLHGPRWGDPTLADAGMTDAGPEDGTVLKEVMASTTESFLDRFASELDAAEVIALEGVADTVDRWLVGRPERRAPVHGDYRLDNLMFAPDGTVTALDWQTLSLGLPARDVAFLLSTGLSIDDRRAHEADIVEAYRRALETHGVQGHGPDECFDDYAFSMLQGPLIAELGWLVADTTERGDAMFMTMVRRACAAIVDLDTFSRI